MGRQSVAEPVDRGTVELTFGHGALDTARIVPGQRIWKTDDPQLTARLRKTFAGKPQRRVPLGVTVQAAVGERLSIEARTPAGVSCRVESEAPLEPARKHPLTVELLREQLGRLGGTHYELAACRADITGEPMVPLSVLGLLRHALVAALDEAAARPPRRMIAEHSVLAAMREPLAEHDRAPANRAPALHVLCRSLAQLQAVVDCGVASVLADLQDIRQYDEAVALAHAAGATIFIATPRIQKPDEMGILRVMLRHGADGILVRNLAGLEFYAAAGVPLVADFSLNATNELTVERLRAAGARRVTASYDLNRDQLLDLVAAVPPAWLEVVVHQHMPMFHMEHCVFCAVLSPGTNKHNCGRPCDVHQVRLRDRVGMEHPLTADVGCRNTLFNAVPQSAAEVVPELIARGVRDFRVELLDDAPREEIARLIDLYRRLLVGELRGQRGVHGAAGGQPGWRHPGHDGRAAQSAGHLVTTLQEDAVAADSSDKPVLVLGTANRKKAGELADLLRDVPLAVRTLADFDRPLDVDETGGSFAENAALKAAGQAKQLGQWVLADDSGLIVDALNGAPGIYSARYAGPGATDADNRRKLLAELAGVEPPRRTARFVCHLALTDAGGTIRATASGACHGRIRLEEAGTGGFGYDPLFEIVEYHRTFGELGPATKACLSHRARAMYALVPHICNLLAAGEWQRG